LARNSAAAEKPSFAFRLRTGKRGRAKIPSPFTRLNFAKQNFGGRAPFLFARPSENHQKSASGFSLKYVRISFSVRSKQKSPFRRFFGRIEESYEK
jgi:hypothetical protein